MADRPHSAPLSAEDLSILALENDTVVGHTCKVIVLDGAIDLALLRASIESRLDRAPQLRTRLEDVDGAPCWCPDPSFELSRHVVLCALAEPPDQVGLEAAVAHLFEQRLDRSRPLWRMDLIPELADGGSALIWRIHHALADGSTAMRMARAVVWQEVAGDPARARATRPPSPPSSPRHRLEGVRAALRESPHLVHRSPFAGNIGSRREVAFATTELAGLRRVASLSEHATVNDAVLTVVTGGLRRWLEDHHGKLGTVRVKVPVSMHGEPNGHDAQEGNRDSFFCLDVPLVADPLDRLVKIRRATRVRKQGHDAEHLDSLMRELGRTPRLRHFAERVLANPRSFALNISNVPGPRGPISVEGVPVRALHSIAEIREHHALRVAVVSLAGRLSFGLSADPALVPGVGRLARHIELDATELIARVEEV